MKRGRSRGVQNRDASFLNLATTLLKFRDTNTQEFKKAAADAGVSLRKAYYLAEMAEKLRPLMRQRSRLEGIGWTRLTVITKHLTEENAPALLTLAEGNTAHQLAALMRDGTPRAGTRTVLLRLSPEDYHQFAQTILQHGGKRSGRGLRGQEQALMNIIAKAGASPTPGKPTKPL